MGLWLRREALCFRSRTKLQENCSCGCHRTCPLGQPGPAEKASHVASPCKAGLHSLQDSLAGHLSPPSLDFSWTQLQPLCQVVWGKCVRVPGQRKTLHQRVSPFSTTWRVAHWGRAPGRVVGVKAGPQKSCTVLCFQEDRPQWLMRQASAKLPPTSGATLGESSLPLRSQCPHLYVGTVTGVTKGGCGH